MLRATFSARGFRSRVSSVSAALCDRLRLSCATSSSLFDVLAVTGPDAAVVFILALVFVRIAFRKPEISAGSLATARLESGLGGGMLVLV